MADQHIIIPTEFLYLLKRVPQYEKEQNSVKFMMTTTGRYRSCTHFRILLRADLFHDLSKRGNLCC